jgi:two-component system sensor histidine kinase/response regulator
MVTSSPQDTLLIIDDMPENVMVLLHFLTNKGFTVLVAQDGEEGIETAEYTNPDLILLDVMMPGIDGFEVCDKLKSSDKLKDIPIIFMTALSDTVDKVKGFSLGAADYITKPIQQEEVLARIKTHIKLRKLQLQLQEQNQYLQEEISFRKQIEEYLQNTANVLAERSVELRERSSELEQRSAELEKRNQELDAFAHMVAHDLKNPLATITGFTDLLLEESVEFPSPYNQCVERLKFVKQASEQMFNIVDALLILAGVSRHPEPVLRSLDMGRIVNQVIEQRLAMMIADYQAKIVLPKQWPVAFGFATWIEEIWVNYLSNAIKYGGTPPQIKLGADPQNNEVIRFWVRDNGQGLEPQEQAKLFTPFTRLHKSRAKGHGLGLTIVQQIVEKLGGNVGVESASGKGSLFYFTLPANNWSKNSLAE